MEVDQPSGPRFDLALALFQKGERLIIDNLSLGLSPDGYLDIYVQSSWLPENVTEQTLIHDLKAAEKNIRILLEQSDALKSLVEARPWRLILVDSTKVDHTEIAHYENGSLSWAVGFPVG